MVNFIDKFFGKRNRALPAYAAKVRQEIEKLPELSAKLEFLMHNRQFRVDQKKPEFLSLLNKVAESGAKRILEIGGRRGGSSILFAQAAGDDASVLTVDLNNKGGRLKSLNELIKGRDVLFWQGDSHTDESFERVKNYLDGALFDVVFIDGDHTYEGAKQDFMNYSKLAKKGGIIALHDIQEDYKTRFGVDTNSWTGGVPTFWQEIKAADFNTEELISDPYQDGYGIGVVYWNAEAEAAHLQKLGN